MTKRRKENATGWKSGEMEQMMKKVDEAHKKRCSESGGSYVQQLKRQRKWSRQLLKEELDEAGYSGEQLYD